MKISSHNKFYIKYFEISILILAIVYGIHDCYYRQDPLAIFVIQSKLILDGFDISYIDQPGILINYLSIPILYIYGLFSKSNGGIPGFFQANIYLYFLNYLILLFGFYKLVNLIDKFIFEKFLFALIIINPIVLTIMGSADGYAYALAIVAVSQIEVGGNIIKNLKGIFFLALSATAKSLYLIDFIFIFLAIFNSRKSYADNLKNLLMTIVVVLFFLLIIIFFTNFPVLSHFKFVLSPKITNFDHINLIDAIKNNLVDLIYHPEIYLLFLYTFYLIIKSNTLKNSETFFLLLILVVVSFFTLILVSARPYKSDVYIFLLVPIYIAILKLITNNQLLIYKLSYFSKYSALLILVIFQLNLYMREELEIKSHKIWYQEIGAVLRGFDSLNDLRKSNVDYEKLFFWCRLPDGFSSGIYSDRLIKETYDYFRNNY
ncbi:hypothetical protein [Polynucleobacter sp. CS-Odin-A6]|uniref:hypothetical protein n=1 Tax=Polynucleobacter sp. CS-Odin-A6 TaxID=2689106 RepID=UPI001C0ADC5D|nr:hypothetical protein [Polynucleobacter sp. CS-Odin-A6]MBU3621105.1 hypothetical protein [Polynucleobacter sp. CS-Odin-A6]